MKSSSCLGPRLRQLAEDPLILPFYVPSVILFLGTGIIIPVLPLYAESFGVSYGWVGAVASAQALGMLVSDLPCGVLLRRLGQKRSLVLGTAVMVLFFVAQSWASSVQEAFAYRFLAGFGVALFGVARHAYISEHASAANRGRAMALFGGLMRVDRLLGPLLGGYIALATGLRVPFLVAGLISLVALLCILLFVPRDVGSGPREAKPPQAPAISLGQLLRGQAAILAPAGIGHILVQMIRSGRDTVIPLYAANALGLDVAQVGLLVGIASAVEMVMFLPAGWIMDKRGRKYSFVPSFGIQALAMAAVPLTGSFAQLLACATAIGMANGLSSGGMMTLGADLAPPDARGEFLGVWRLIGDVGATGGPAAVGFVADALVLPAAALVLASAGLGAALIFAFFLPETLHHKPARVTPCRSAPT
ncbi:MAG: MFS transporter [Anaerolineae bacterium]|jgi:MFS family permease